MRTPERTCVHSEQRLSRTDRRSVIECCKLFREVSNQFDYCDDCIRVLVSC